jgi:hypothetical protein
VPHVTLRCRYTLAIVTEVVVSGKISTIDRRLLPSRCLSVGLLGYFDGGNPRGDLGHRSMNREESISTLDRCGFYMLSWLSLNTLISING